MPQSLLSRLAYVGLAKETTQGTYVAPTVILPVAPSMVGEDVFAELKDESLRNNDSVVQGIYQGPGDSTFDFDMLAYPVEVGHLLRAMIGPDTVTAGATSTLSASTAVGAATFTTAATFPAGAVLQIDTGTNVEYCSVQSVSGAGPYTITPVKPLTVAHTSGAAVASQTTHKFAQSNTRMPSYSLTDFDVVEARGFPGCVLAELGVKIDPKGSVNLVTKWAGYPSQAQATPAPTFTGAQPFLGWQWTMTNGGASSNRGLTLDLTVKREVEAVHASIGAQNPEEVFPGPLTLDGTYKARFDSNTDLNLFLTYAQQPVVATLTQPAVGPQQGAVLTFTASKTGFIKGKRNFAGKYIDGDFTLAGIQNSTDGGTLSATLQNFVTTAY